MTRGTRRRPFTARAAAAAGAVALAVTALSGCGGTGSGATSSSATTNAATTSATTAPTTTSATTTSTTTTSATTSAPSTTASVDMSASATKAAAKIKKLTAYLGSGGVSVEAVNLHSGDTFSYGASGGMRTGSIVKLYILETLLLRDQNAGTTLTSAQKALATRMIENSDNNAASALWDLIGGGSALKRAAAALGVHHTVPGPGGYWGLTQTCAADYISLLRNLVQPRALSAASRSYIRGLMAQVEADQRWGVSAAADPGTTVELKNGWLATQHDDDRWLVNSVGIITVDGQTVLLAIMTQHGSSFDGGIALVQSIAKVAAPVVAQG